MTKTSWDKAMLVAEFQLAKDTSITSPMERIKVIACDTF
jgi:hypothetical protein